MKKIITLALIVSTCTLAFPQDKVKHNISRDDKGNIKSVEFDPNFSSPANANAFFEEFLTLDSKTVFKKMSIKTNGADEVHEIHRQFYNGIPVEEAGYSLHFAKGKLTYAQGNYVKIQDLNTTPTISADGAARALATHLGIPFDLVSSYESELVVKSNVEPGNVAICVYKTQLRANHERNDKIGFVDILSGNVLDIRSMFVHVAATGTFATRYNGTRQAITESINGSFRLEDLTRGAPITTWNMNGSTSLSTRVHLTDNNNNWTSAEHSPSKNDMGLDVHWGLQKIYDHLSSKGINSFNNAGWPIAAHIKYGSTDALRDNSGWHMTDHYLVFGEGGDDFKPMASLDVVGHECGHALTDFQTSWTNTGMHLVFHEGMADIWGAIFEYRINGSNPNNWKIGETVPLNKASLRNIQNTNDATTFQVIADTYLGTQYNNATNAYIKSGVLSHWFYVLVNGESGTNDVGWSYNVTGIGMDKAQEIIQKALFSGYLTFNTTYPDLRTSIINATIAKYCNNSSEVAAVTNAWYAVGVGSAYSGTVPAITGNDPVCGSQNFSIQNQIAGTTPFWSSGNTSQMTVSPQSAVTTTTATRVNNYNGQVNLILTMTGGSGCSNTLTRSLQVGAFNSGTITVTGQSAVCPGNLYTYTANVPGGHRTGYIYNWTRPANWSVNSQNANSIIYYVPLTSPDYGPVQVSVNNGCGLSGPSGITAFPGFGCGGFMFSVFPNPTSSTLSIELSDENSGTATSLSKTTGVEFTAELVNSRGKKVFSVLSINKIAIINTDEYPKGLYFLNLIVQGDVTTKRVLLE